MPRTPLQSARPVLHWLLLVALASLSILISAGSGFAQNGPPAGTEGRAPQGPKEVGTIVMAIQDVPYVRTLPGRAVAYEAADIRPRVSGAVEEVLYSPGDVLKPGDKMFKIEDASYRAALASAEAALAGAEVEVATAQATVDRYRSLQGSSVTSATLQQAEAAAAAAVASLAAAKAALDAAKLDLDRTIVASPIGGIAGLPAVSVGSLVTANQSEALSTVTRLDPIYIDVSDSSASILRIRDRFASGSLLRGDKVGVSLTLENGQAYSLEGSVVAPGNVVSSTTGTIDVRVQFDNPDRMILPGQFLRVDITLGTSTAWLVPQRATGRKSDGTLTAWIAKDGVTEQVILVADGSYENSWVVSEGLSDGDLLIVDGLSNMKAGTEVIPVPVTIDANGVVVDQVATDGVEPAAKPVTAAPAATGGN